MQIIHAKPLFDVPLYRDVREIFAAASKRYDAKSAFMYRENPGSDIITKSFVELKADIDALGTSILDLGLRGKRIAVIGENSYRWAISYLAVLSGAGVTVPLDRLLPEDEILGLLERGEVAAVFFDGHFLETMKKAQERMPNIAAFVCMRGGRFKSDFGEDFPDEPGFYRFDKLLEKGHELLRGGDTRFADVVIDPMETAALLFTSGTTSAAKGVLLSSDNLVKDVYGLSQMERFPVGCRYLSVLSMHHTFESTCGLLFGLSLGMCCCVCDGLRYIQKNLKEYKINLMVGVPILFETFYKKIQAGLAEKGKLQTVNRMIKITGFLRKIGIDIRRKVFREVLGFFGGEFQYGICGAAPIDPKIIHFLEGIGLEVYQGYGLTETSPVIAACNPKNLIPGTVGLPMGGATIAIDTAVDYEEGEILVKGPMVMQGYFNAPELTAEVIDKDGWFHTGDYGRIEKKSGCLYITGRIKSMIVLKNGKKVFPEELEHGIGRMPYVKEVLVFGDTLEDAEVVVSAKVVFDKDELDKDGVDEVSLPGRLQELIKDANRKLPHYKAVRQFVYSFEPFEKTTTLKIKRVAETEKIQAFIRDRGILLKSMNGKNVDVV